MFYYLHICKTKFGGVLFFILANEYFLMMNICFIILVFEKYVAYVTVINTNVATLLCLGQYKHFIPKQQNFCVLESFYPQRWGSHL